MIAKDNSFTIVCMANLPPLNALRAFDASGRHLNFRAAAEELGVTQGAVAQHVRALEADLGLPLFDRLPRGLAFTSQGRSYHAHITAAFDDLRNATRTLRPAPSQVLISVTPTFASKWLIPNLPDLAETHPQIDLRILATESVSSFHSDGIDLAVRQGQPPFGSAVTATLLFKQHIIAVAAPIACGEAGGRADLVRLPQIHDAHNHWPDFLDHAGLASESDRTLRLNQTALAIDAARAGQGVALVSHFLVEPDLQAGHLVQLVPDVLPSAQDFYLLAPRKAKNGGASTIISHWLTTRAKSG